MDEQLSLFDLKSTSTSAPLAEKIRPTELSDIVGQDLILGKGKQLRAMIEQDDYRSFILWGPPGVGKTTIAKLIEQKTNHHFVSFSAVLSSIKDVKKVMKEADYTLQEKHKKTILFVDEIHRFNKSQQDAFLPYVESGSVILIGATTENPSFEVISALLSRCQVFVLQALSEEQIFQILNKAIQKIEYSNYFDEEVLHYISQISDGDCRKGLNYLESIIKSETENKITLDRAREIINKNTMFYDKNGEEHYNVISALHKSLRGSDPQAGLYWLARMLEAGDDPLYIVRRLIRFASEDIGLADPNAIVQAIAVKDAVHFLGMPEANTALSQLVIYLATAPKSNAIYIAYKAARSDAEKSSHLGVPLSIRNSPTKLMKDLGYSKNYLYDHEYQNAYHYQKYFPAKMEEKKYYKPSNFGFEKDIQKRLKWWDKLNRIRLK